MSKPTNKKTDVKKGVNTAEENVTENTEKKESTSEIKTGFNPLGGSVDEKNYAGAGARQFTQQELQGDIPEPTFQPPPPDENDIPTAFSTSQKKKEKEKEKPAPTFNPDMQSLPDKDKEEAAEKGAKFVMDMYKGLHGLANQSLKISDKKLNKLQMNGEIDMNVVVPYGDQGGVRFGDFVNDFNSQTEETLTVTPEFEKDVMPPLTRVLAKRGHGMTDEQYLMFAFGKDILAKGYMWYQIKSTVNDILKFGKDQTASGGYKGPAAQNNAPQNNPPNQPTPSYAEPEQAPADMQQEAVVIPIQDRILAQHLPTANTSDGLPKFGNQAHLDNVDKTQASTEKLVTKSAKSRLADAGAKIRNSKRKSDVPEPPKKRGRKLGSKNRKK